MKAKRSIWMAGLSLLLCIAMLAGTTFAWFSDSISNKNNRIQAGTLDIELYKATDAVDTTLETDDVWTKVENDSEPIINNDIYNNIQNWQPGEFITVYLAVKNNGTLALKYNLDLVIKADTLSQALLIGYESSKVEVPEVGENAATTPVSSAITTASGEKIIPTAPNGELGKGEVEYITIVIKFDPLAGDFYQGGIFDFDVILTATQTNATADSLVKAYTVKDINEAKPNATVVLMKNINEPENVLTVENFINLDLNGYTLTVKSITIGDTDHAGIMEIADGTIEISGSMTIDLPLGTVNQTNVTIKTTGAGSMVSLNVAPHSYNLLNGSKIIAESLELKGKTRLAMDIGTQLQADTIIFEVPEPDTGEEPGDPTPPPKPKIEQAPGSSITNQAGDAPELKDTNGDGIDVDDFIKEVDGKADGGVTVPAGFNIIVNNIDELTNAINNAKDGDKIFMMPGDYPITESLIINKSITLYGPNYDKTGFSTLRSNEAVLFPAVATENVDYNKEVTTPFLEILSASDVSIVGINFVGKNPNSINAYDWGAAIYAYANGPVSDNLLIKNNRFTSFYGQVLSLDTYGSTTAQTRTNLITGNYFGDIFTLNQGGYGIAIAILRNAYTDIINNVIDGARQGIQINSCRNDYVYGTPVISDNTISAVSFGIFVNLSNDLAANGWIIENNNVSHFDNGGNAVGSSGILIGSSKPTDSIVMKNNTISGFETGICVWNTSAPALELIGGTITNCTNAIGMISYQASYGLGSSNPNQYLTVSTLPTITNCTNKFYIDNTLNNTFSLNVTDPAFNVNDVVVYVTGTGKVLVNGVEVTQ